MGRPGKPPKIDPELTARARQALHRAKTVKELRAAQAALWPAVGITGAQAAALLGVARHTVDRLRKRFQRSLAAEGAGAGESAESSPHPAWGGRRSGLMTLQEETEFLELWEPNACDCGLPSMVPVRTALEERLGRPVAGSVFYRMLARHGWRRVGCGEKRRLAAERRRRWPRPPRQSKRPKDSPHWLPRGTYD